MGRATMGVQKHITHTILFVSLHSFCVKPCAYAYIQESWNKENYNKGTNGRSKCKKYKVGKRN